MASGCDKGEDEERCKQQRGKSLTFSPGLPIGSASMPYWNGRSTGKFPGHRAQMELAVVGVVWQGSFGSVPRPPEGGPGSSRDPQPFPAVCVCLNT